METQELIRQLRDFRNTTENWVLLKRLMEEAADKLEELEGEISEWERSNRY